MERRKYNRSGSVSGSHTYVGRDTAKILGFEIYGISERKKQYDALRTIWRIEI